MVKQKYFFMDTTIKRRFAAREGNFRTDRHSAYSEPWRRFHDDLEYLLEQEGLEKYF